MTEIHGHWQPGCEAVIAAFAANFSDAGEEGAALSVYHRGVPLIDIYAGHFNNRAANLTRQAWTQDTRVNIYSAGKSLVAATVVWLIAEGKLSLDMPIAAVWPEFAANGKAEITLRHVLAHRSGVSAFHDRIADETVFDWAAVTAAIAAETPWFTPDSNQGYSPFLYGWILGEVVRRVTGADSFDQVFRQYIAAPLQLSAAFGLADEEMSGIADVAPLKRPAVTGDAGAMRTEGADSASVGRLMKSDPRGITNRAFANPMSLLTSTNSSQWRAAQVPAANAHASASDLAKFYSALAEETWLPEPVRSLCWQQQSSGADKVLGVPLRFGCGFMLTREESQDSRFGRGERAFGHPGAGGSLGFADPDYHIGFGYVTSRVGQNVLIDERVIRLIDALYQLPEIQA